MILEYQAVDCVIIQCVVVDGIDSQVFIKIEQTHQPVQAITTIGCPTQFLGNLAVVGHGISSFSSEGYDARAIGHPVELGTKTTIDITNTEGIHGLVTGNGSHGCITQIPLQAHAATGGFHVLVILAIGKHLFSIKTLTRPPLLP